MFKKIKLAGFTLIELIIVVTIIGILAVVSIPIYVKSRERVIDQEAQAILRLIAMAERNYNLATGIYYVPAGTEYNLDTINGLLATDLVASPNWNLSIEQSGSNYTAKMNRGGVYPRTWSIDNTDVFNATCDNCP